MVRSFRFICSIAICLLLPSILYAQRRGNSSMDSERRALGGTVYFPGNKPAENVNVALHSSEGSFIAPAITNASGSFEFYNLAPGSYAVSVDEQGYNRIEIPIDLTLTSNRGVIIYLAPTSSSSPAVSHSSSTVSAHELSMPQKARELMASGKKKLYLDKDPQGSLEDFHQALSVAPDYYEADYQVALAYLAMGKMDDAEKNFRKSIDVSGDKYGDADVGLGKVLIDRGDATAAEKTILRGLELTPTSSRGFYELGRAQLTEKKLPDAEKSAVQARTLDPDFPMVYRLLAIIHVRENNYNALIQDLDAYIKLDPDSPAGARAKQMREQVQAKLSTEASAPPVPQNR
jgi:tetratricopeptide (TPR) repeat protein